MMSDGGNLQLLFNQAEIDDFLSARHSGHARWKPGTVVRHGRGPGKSNRSHVSHLRLDRRRADWHVHRVESLPLDVSQLYSTGDVTLVPEPATVLPGRIGGSHGSANPSPQVR